MAGCALCAAGFWAELICGGHARRNGCLRSAGRDPPGGDIGMPWGVASCEPVGFGLRRCSPAAKLTARRTEICSFRILLTPLPLPRKKLGKNIELQWTISKLQRPGGRGCLQLTLKCVETRMGGWMGGGSQRRREQCLPQVLGGGCLHRHYDSSDFLICLGIPIIKCWGKRAKEMQRERKEGHLVTKDGGPS